MIESMEKFRVNAFKSDKNTSKHCRQSWEKKVESFNNYFFERSAVYHRIYTK